jgi:hypothetical protein
MNVRFFTPFPSRALSVLLLAFASVMLASCARTDSFDWGRVALFSAVSGKVLYRGEPVAGLTLTQTVDWSDDIRTHTAVTDKGGNFAFTAVKTFSLLHQILPAQTRIGQSIKTTHLGKQYEIWAKSKTNYDNNGELFYYDYSKEPEPQQSRPRKTMADPKKIPITTTCELSTEVRIKPDGRLDWDWFESRGPKGSLGFYCQVD